MLHYVHQLALHFICVLFGAGQVAYSGVYQTFFPGNSCLLLLDMRSMRKD